MDARVEPAHDVSEIVLAGEVEHQRVRRRSRAVAVGAIARALLLRILQRLQEGLDQRRGAVGWRLVPSLELKLIASSRVVVEDDELSLPPALPESPS